MHNTEKTPVQVSATETKEFYLSSAEQTLEDYGTDLSRGLTEEEARSRLEKYGRNAFEKQKKKGGSKGGMSVTLLNRPQQWPRRGIKTILFSGLYEFKTEEFRVASCRRDKQVNGAFLSGIVCQYVQCDFIIRRS